MEFKFSQSDDFDRLLKDDLSNDKNKLSTSKQKEFEETPQNHKRFSHKIKKKKFCVNKLSKDDMDYEIDLHHHTKVQALQKISDFFRYQKSKKMQYLLIITGKGNNSGTGGAVLRPAVADWLNENKQYYNNYCSPCNELGGSGSFLVILD